MVSSVQLKSSEFLGANLIIKAKLCKCNPRFILFHFNLDKIGNQKVLVERNHGNC
jgi:hypothetical protein